MNKRANIVSGLLFFLMAIICVALLMPTVRESITTGASGVPSNFTNAGILVFLINFWPLFFILFCLFVFLIIIANR